MMLTGPAARRIGGNYVDRDTGESVWASDLKKNGEDRHWAGAGKVLVEAAARANDPNVIGAKTLDKSRCEPTVGIRQTGIKRLSQRANSSAEASPMPPNKQAIRIHSFATASS